MKRISHKIKWHDIGIQTHIHFTEFGISLVHGDKHAHCSRMQARTHTHPRHTLIHMPLSHHNRLASARTLYLFKSIRWQ